jgi:UDP-glucose 4-epimerase
MQKEVIIITGSGGFIGTALIDALAGKYHIFGLDKSPDETNNNVENIPMDITSDKEVSKVFSKIREKSIKMASVVHLAAYYDFEGEPSHLYEEITVKGTERLLTQLKDLHVEQFIFSSSMLVYKPTVPGRKIHEEWPLEPKWDYPQSKVKTEKLIHRQRGKIPFVNLRVSGVYNDEGNSIPIAQHIKRINEKQMKSYFFPGNTTHGSAFIHLNDLLDAIEKTIEKRKSLPEEITMNISEEQTLAYSKIQKIISREIHGKEMPVYSIPKLLAKTGAFLQNLFGQAFIKPWMIDLADDHYEMDCSKAKNIINWAPKHSLKETLPKIITGFRNNPDEWYKKNELE